MLPRIDKGQFPLAAEYVTSLPAGLDSYPQCLTNPDHTLLALEEFPNFFAGQSQLTAAWRGTRWIPDVHYVALRLMLRECPGAFANDAQFLDWNRRTSAEVFKKPLYRVLMYVLSPTLMLMGAAKRWAIFRKGSSLQLLERGSRNTAVMELTHPPGIYPRLILEVYGQGIHAALRAAGASQVMVGVVEVSAEKTHYRVTWK